jgi:hypothetical protein
MTGNPVAGGLSGGRFTSPVWAAPERVNRPAAPVNQLALPTEDQGAVGCVLVDAPPDGQFLDGEWKVLMLRNRGVRSRVLAVLSLPVLALVVAAAAFSL